MVLHTLTVVCLCYISSHKYLRATCIGEAPERELLPMFFSVDPWDDIARHPWCSSRLNCGHHIVAHRLCWRCFRSSGRRPPCQCWRRWWDRRFLCIVYIQLLACGGFPHGVVGGVSFIQCHPGSCKTTRLCARELLAITSGLAYPSSPSSPGSATLCTWVSHFSILAVPGTSDVA